MRFRGYALVSSAAAVLASPVNQDERSVYRDGFPLRLSATAGAYGPMGEAELTIWTRGDSAFGLWRTLDEDSLRFDNLVGRKTKEAILLQSSPRQSHGKTSSGPAALDIRYEFRVTRWDDSLHAEMTLAVLSTLEGRQPASPRTNISGVRLRRLGAQSR